MLLFNSFKYLLKYVYCFLLFILVVFAYSTPVSAVYIEEFNGSLSYPLDWDVPTNSGIAFTPSNLVLVNSSGQSFPYIVSRNDLLNANTKSVEIKFKYGFAGGFGTGIALTDSLPQLGTVMTYPSKFYQHTIFYVWQNNLSPFLHIKSSLCSLNQPLCNAANMPTIFQTSAIDTSWHNLKIELLDDISYKIYFDEGLIFESVKTNRILSAIWIGNPETTNTTNTWSSINVDYIKVTTNTNSISFPYFSQRDSRWKDIEYDAASTWAESEQYSIERWGCALTSVAMILNKYNVKMPSGAVADPLNLNTWLKSEPDGYIGNGLINWLAVTRLARKSRLGGNSPTDLEFVKSSGIPKEELEAGLYPIVNTGGHFVVTHGVNPENYDINDPFEASRSALPTTTPLLSVNTYIPSNTDLSYFMITGDSSTTATLSGSLGVVESQIFDESIIDDIGSTTSPITRTVLFSKPPTDVYQLKLHNAGNSTSTINIYLYFENGEVTTKSTQLSANESKVLEINYDKSGVTAPTFGEIDITAPPTPTDLAPADGSVVRNDNLVLDWGDVADSSSPITYWYKSSWNAGSYGPVSTGSNSYINASGSAERTYTWYVKACDGVGNCSEWTNGTKLIVDNTAPTADLIFPTPGPSSKYFEVVFSERVNSESATNPQNYFLNNWPGAGGSGNLIGDAEINYDANTNTARINFTNSNWYISPEQQWGVENIVDLAGNKLSPNPTTEYSTQMVKPSTPIVKSTLTSPTNNGIQSWVWSSSDSGSGIKGYYEQIYDVLKLLPGEWYWIGNVGGINTNLSDGIWQVNVKAEDNAGNLSLIGSSEQLIIDTIAPATPTLLSPDDNVVINGKYVLQDWSDSEGASKYLYESYHDADLKNLRYRGSFVSSQKDASNIAESSYYWRVAAMDLSGNQSDWSIHRKVVIDNTTPKLTSKSSFSGWHNIAQTSYFDFEDANMIPSYLAPNCEISTEGMAQTCELSANVCDKAGNCYTSKLSSNSCDIDLTKPTTILNAWGTTIDGTASDNLSGISHTDIEITKPDNNSMVVTAIGTTNWSYTMTESSLGKYKIVVRSYDKAGNKSNDIVKEFVMSERSIDPSIGSVAGVSTENDDVISEMVDQREEEEMKTDENDVKYEETKDSGATSEVIENESVLGATTENKSKNWWWLIAGFVVIGSMVFTISIFMREN